MPLKGGWREQVYINISILYRRRQELADVKQLLQSYTARQWQRKPDPGAVIFLLWPLKHATLMKSRVPRESHVSASNESLHCLRFTGINPGGIRHV